MFKTTSLTIPKLPSFNAVILTDLHVGSPTCSLNYLRKIVKEVNYLRPDFVFLLGDVTNYDKYRLFDINGKIEPLSEIFFTLNELNPIYKTLSVEGNHEHQLGIEEYNKVLSLCNNIDDISNKQYMVELKKGEQIKFVGLSDPHSAEDSHLLRDWDKISDAFILSHSPSNFISLNYYNNDFYKYGVCGHTHGMQGLNRILSLNYNKSFAWLTRRLPFICTKEGHNEIGNGFYLSSGLGTSCLPFRFDKPKVDFLIFN